MCLEQLKRLLDEVAQHHALPLAVLDLVAQVGVLLLVQVENWQDLTVVGHESFSDSLRASNKCLKDFQSNSNDFAVSGVQGCLDWDDQLRNDWEDFSSTLLQHVKDTLNGEETVGIGLLTDSLEEDWQVMMVIQLLDINFPGDFVLWSMFNGNWKISTLVESSEIAYWNVSLCESSSDWLLNNWLFLWFVQRNSLASHTFSLLEDSSAFSGNRLLMLLNWLNCRYFGLFVWHIILWEVTKW